MRSIILACTSVLLACSVSYSGTNEIHLTADDSVGVLTSDESTSTSSGGDKSTTEIVTSGSDLPDGTICIPPPPNPPSFYCGGRPVPSDPCGTLISGCLEILGESNPSCLAVADTCLDGQLWDACAALADACDTVQPNPPDCYDLVVACTCWTSPTS